MRRPVSALVVVVCFLLSQETYAQPAPPRQGTIRSESSVLAKEIIAFARLEPPHSLAPEPMPPAQTKETRSDSLRLVDSLKATRERIERLQSILDKVAFSPTSYYFTKLRSWVIPLSDAFNDTLAQYFFEVTDNDSSFIEARGDIQVVATPEPSTDIIDIFFTGGNKDKKGIRLRELLMKKKDRNMYQRALSSREFGEDKELIDRSFKIKDNTAPFLIKDSDSILVAFTRYALDGIDQTTARVGTIRFPDNIRLHFGDEWGFEVKLGNEEIGYPLWTSGNIAFLIGYHRIKVGLQVPFAWGRESDIPEGIRGIFAPRKLDGVYGLTSEFDWAYAGGNVTFGFKRSDPDGRFADSRKIYTIRTSAQIWYSYSLNINNNSNLIRFKMGFGITQVGYDKLVAGSTSIVNGASQTAPDVLTQVEPVRFLWGPYLKVEYMNQQFKKRFGANLQYYRDWAFGGPWLEVIPNALRLELKVGTTVLRKTDPWEPSFVFLLSVPYTFTF